jgi:glycosyltransferase involved in cell wall biosynthesis
MNDALQNLLVQIDDVNFQTERDVPVAHTKKGRLCLNMIVKNESKIIERLLGSVLSIIDCYCICDTGSTDDTAEKIRAFMTAADKPGEVYSEPFKNFGYNRTHALERAARWGEFALLLDADMRLRIGSFTPDMLTNDGYSIVQCTTSGSMEYYNLRIARTGVGIRCVGPTHEYYDVPAGRIQTRLSKDVLHIEDIGDGGCKSDKFERDIRLLTEGLKDEPKNERYHFYLANSHRDLGHYKEAIEWYKKRVALGGWIEEVFYAAYECGTMYAKLGDMPNAIYWWLEAYNKHPKRSESIYEITKFYREAGKQAAAQIFCTLGLSIPFPKDDVLFIKKPVYDYLFTYEQSVLSYYTKTPVNHYKYLDLIGQGFAHTNVLSNYQFYIQKLSDAQGVRIHTFDDKLTATLDGCTMDFVSSTPCIFKLGDEYGLNIRYVNYSIQPDGGYKINNDRGKIPSLYKYCVLNQECSVLESHMFDSVQDPTLKYQGIEDVKVFPHRGTLLFLGTVEVGPDRLTLGHGTYDTSQNLLQSRPFESPNSRSCEKNWAYAHNAKGDLRVVYEWSPLTIGAPNNNKLDILHTYTSVPAFFKDLRGSSHGCLVGDEVWFVCHMVYYGKPRHYYHILVILNASDMSYKKHSIPFKFSGEPIEYCLGLVVDSDKLLMSYSSMDKTSRILELPRSVAARTLFPDT